MLTELPPAVTAPQPAPCNGNCKPATAGSSTCLSSLKIFLAIQPADNVNNTDNNHHKKKLHQVSGGMQNFPGSFLGWGVKGWKLNNALPEPLKAQHL